MSFTHVPEILERIAASLDPQSLRRFRLTKRWHYRISRPAFAASHFTTLELDFTPHTRRRLHNVAQDEYFRRAVRELQVVIRPQSSPADLGAWSLTSERELDITSREAARVLKSVFSLENCTCLRIDDQSPLFLAGDQYYTALSIFDASYLFLSTFADPRCPFSGEVNIIDRTFWPDPRRGHGSSRAFLEMVRSRRFQVLWQTRVNKLRYTWAAASHPPSWEGARVTSQSATFTIGNPRLSPHMLHSGVLASLSGRVPTALALDGVGTNYFLLAAFVTAHRKTLRSLSLRNIRMSLGMGPMAWIGFFAALERTSFPLLEEVSLGGLRNADPDRLSTQGQAHLINMYFSRLLCNPAGMTACGGRFEFRRSPKCRFRYPDVRYIGPPSSMGAAIRLFGEGISDITGIPGDPDYWLRKLHEFGDSVIVVES